MERAAIETVDYERMYEAAAEMARSLIRETNAKGEKILRLRAEVRELREKVGELRYNPYHDPTNGRFTSPNGGGSGVNKVGKIDIRKYKCITSDIVTDEVIITDERISHIKERHNNDYELLYPLFQETLASPDYILEDSQRKNTGLILKHYTKKDVRVQIVLRIQTSSDESGFKNSIISAWKISDTRWENYIKNKKVLYKSE